MSTKKAVLSTSATGLLTGAVGALLISAATAGDARSTLGAAATVTTTRGDLIRRGATADERVALGTSGHVLTSNGTDAVWAAPAGSTPTAGLDGARPTATLGALYTATDTGVRYLCESNGSGGARWAVVGARGNEGRDTTAVYFDGSSTYADTSVTIVGSTIVSFAAVFAMHTAPSGQQVILTVNPNTGTDGLYLSIGRDAGDRYLIDVYRFGFSTPLTYLTGATISGSPATLHCVAVTLEANAVRFSLDGAAVQSESNGTGSAAVGTAALRLGRGSAGGYLTGWMTTAVLWSTAVGDSDLVAVSGAARAAGSTPGRIPAVSGATEIVRWHAGWQRAPLLTEPLLSGSLGGSLTWSAAPTLVVR